MPIPRHFQDNLRFKYFTHSNFFVLFTMWMAKFDCIQFIENFILYSIHEEKADYIKLYLLTKQLSLQLSCNGIGLTESQLDFLKSKVLREDLNDHSNYHLISYLEKLLIHSCPRDSKILVEIISQNCNSNLEWKIAREDEVWKEIFFTCTPSKLGMNSGTTVTISLIEPIQKEKGNEKLLYAALISQLKKLITSFFLLHWNTSFFLKTDLCNSVTALEACHKVCNALSAVRQLFRCRNRNSVAIFNGSSQHFKIKGMIVVCRQRPLNSLFVYANGHLVESNDITCFLRSLTSRHHISKKRYWSAVVNIKCSRSIYKIIKITNKIKEIEFYFFLEELLSLIRSSLKDLISTRLSLVNRGNRDILSTNRSPQCENFCPWTGSLVSSENCLSQTSIKPLTTRKTTSNRDPSIDKTAIDDSDRRALSVVKMCGSSSASSTDSFGKLSTAGCSMVETDIRITEPPENITCNVSSKPLNPQYLLNLWSQGLENWHTLECDSKNELVKDGNGAVMTTNYKKHFSEPLLNESSSSNQGLCLTSVKTKRKLWTNIAETAHIYDKFWTQPNLPSNIALNRRSVPPTFHHNCNLKKSTLSNINVVNQVDRKFIGCIARENDERYLLLIDQHAAHERICLEKLIQLHSTKDEKGHILVQSSPLHPYLQLTFPPEDLTAIQKLSVDFERFGLHMLFNDLKIDVTHVPACYLAREVNEVQRRKYSTYKRLVLTLIEETLAEYRKNGRLSNCLLPTSIRNVLNSLACHGAIRFGDSLSLTQCSQLIRALSQCDVPFQCAHGRPLLVPLLELNKLDVVAKVSDPERPNFARLRSQATC